MYSVQYFFIFVMWALAISYCVDYDYTIISFIDVQSIKMLERVCFCQSGLLLYITHKLSLSFSLAELCCINIYYLIKCGMQSIDFVWIHGHISTERHTWHLFSQQILWYRQKELTMACHLEVSLLGPMVQVPFFQSPGHTSKWWELRVWGKLPRSPS